MNVDIKRYRRLFVVLAVVGLVVFAALWIGNHGFVEIKIDGADQNTQFRLELKNQDNGKVKVVEAEGSSAKVLLPKGSYEALSRSDDSSLFRIVKTKGWLGTERISGKLIAEDGRKFIGSDVGSCMHSASGLLMSYPCGGLVKNISTHLPATGTSPTLAAKLIKPTEDGDIEGTIETSDGLLALVQLPHTDRSYGEHALYTIPTSANGGAATLKKRLIGLNPVNVFKPGSYGSGFVVYDSSFRDVFYFSSFSGDGRGAEVSAYQPKISDMPFVSADTSTQNIVALFSYDPEDSKGRQASEVILGNHESAVRYEFKSRYSAVRLCGAERLCLIGQKGLEVYDVAGNSPKLLLSMRDTKAVEAIDANSMLVVNDKGVLVVDTTSGTGYLSYSFADYRFAALKPVSGGFVINVLAPNNDKLALSLTYGAKNDDIDKKLLVLRSSPAITNLTAYGNIVIVSPNVGKPVYIPATDSFGYDAGARARAALHINNAVKDAGIDLNTYKVVNTLP